MKIAFWLSVSLGCEAIGIVTVLFWEPASLIMCAGLLGIVMVGLGALVMQSED